MRRSGVHLLDERDAAALERPTCLLAVTDGAFRLGETSRHPDEHHETNDSPTHHTAAAVPHPAIRQSLAVSAAVVVALDLGVDSR